MSRAQWSALLSRPVPVKDGPLLKTLAAAAQLTLKNKATGQRNSWQHAARLLMNAAESGKKADIAAATKQLELALFLENRLKF